MELYVDIKFLNNSGDGTKEKPFGTISEAAAIAQPGDTVHVAPGVYREYVSPANGGTEDARITYVSDVPLGATISGAEQNLKLEAIRRRRLCLRGRQFHFRA